MKFYSRSSKPPVKPSPAGEKEEDVYEIDIDLRGHKTLQKTRMTNVYELIQESLEETKIENIIRRALGGDESALATMHGVYMDVSDAPKSLAEMQQAVITATEEFLKLPIEVREKFNHSAMQYVAEFGTEEWAKKLEMPKTLGQLQEEAAKATSKTETGEGSKTE
ncbi:internal scaffolding protein [Sigmofec virus UA08Rod_5492]|uniref:Internal scaffolding protein n=1 Tax=Sigmofec virus UA08Rod_5492 TaxID=2929426 RepID=A0A976R803_9VIRU|nr:internal scaffolding protein [Sigmofec virus UA08Rod_5492]